MTHKLRRRPVLEDAAHECATKETQISLTAYMPSALQRAATSTRHENAWAVLVSKLASAALRSGQQWPAALASPDSHTFQRPAAPESPDALSFQVLLPGRNEASNAPRLCSLPESFEGFSPGNMFECSGSGSAPRATEWGKRLAHRMPSLSTSG